MEVDLQAVRRVFEQVLTGLMTREQADRWAYSIMQHEEAGSLVYLPPAEKERIWAGVMYLYGVDTVEASGEYLHTDDDIRAAMDEKLGSM